jgi:2,3,4,5-tetrahydropyridine-2-carboxylate N-succinyltransferase
VGYRDASAAGAGLATYDGSGRLLDAWFPAPALGGSEPAPDPQLASHIDEIRGVTVEPIAVSIDSLANPPADAADVYLRLQLLSHRLIRPHEANLDGVFGLLNNVAWTSLGPVTAETADDVRLRARHVGTRLEVYGVDKFPRMTDYVVPSGVRIADADRVRLGAHLAEGTTVMHEGFVNYNAGTLGASMVEGRISAGVVVGDGTDIGGGASIIGTLSGGGTIVVSLGERCLLGANAGIGIPLGDDCVVEAGCYITAGSKVTLPDESVVAARDLAGVSNMLFWRNSVTGRLEAKPRTGSWGGLNAALHAQ